MNVRLGQMAILFLHPILQMDGANAFGALVAIISEVDSLVRLMRSAKDRGGVLEHVMDIKGVLLSQDGTHIVGYLMDLMGVSLDVALR